MSFLRPLLGVAGLVLLCVPARGGEPVLHSWAVAGSVFSLAYSPDGKLLAAQVGSQITLWDTQTGREVRRIAEEPSPGVWSVVFSPDGRTVYAPLQDNTVACWEVATARLVRLFKGHTSTVWSAAVSPDGKVLASGGEDRTVRLWDTVTGKGLFQLNHASGVWPFLFSAAGRELVSVGSDGTLRVWDMKNGREMKQFATDVSCWPLALSADGRTAATVRWQGTPVHLWDLRTGRELRTLEIQPGTGWNLAFSADGRTLASGGPDNALCLWEAATGQERLRLAGHPTKIDAVACGPDGRTAASAGSDGKVILWDVTGRIQDGRLTPARPTARELDALWRDLSGGDGLRAYRAGWTLAAAGNEVVPFLLERARTPDRAPAEAARVTRLIAELDDDKFEVRERASAALEKVGNEVEPALRAALEKSASPEQARRLRSLLDKLGAVGGSPEVVAGRRAVEVLERVGTPAARRALEQIRASRAAPEVSEEARLSLGRLAR